MLLVASFVEYVRAPAAVAVTKERELAGSDFPVEASALTKKRSIRVD